VFYKSTDGVTDTKAVITVFITVVPTLGLESASLGD